MKTAVRAVVVVVVTTTVLLSSACVTVDGLLAEGRLLEACRLADHGGDHGGDDSDLTGPTDDDEPGDHTAVAAATAALIRARVVPIGPDEQAALLGEASPAPVAMAWLAVQAPPSLVLHEVWSGGFVEGEAAARTLAATLPPLEAPPRPSLPPGPLVMPPPATPPSPPSPPRSRGFIDSMFELATLPFTIAGEVGKALITIPLDLFGLRGPRGSSSLANPPPDAEQRDPGEAILPAGAWTAEKERRLAAWAVEVAAVDAAREDRRRRLARVEDALRARCVVAGSGCRRLVVLDEPAADGAALPAVRFKAGIVDVGGTCSVRRPVRVDAPIAPAPSAGTMDIAGAVPVPVPVPTTTTTTTTTTTHVAPPDVAPLATAVAMTRLKAPTATTATTSEEGLSALACRIDVRPAWRRLARQGDLEIRLAAGQTVGRGATVLVPAAARVVVGAALPVQRGDHVKLVVSGNEGWIGGAVAAFDGTLPITLDGGSFVAVCR